MNLYEPKGVKVTICFQVPTAPDYHLQDQVPELH